MLYEFGSLSEIYRVRCTFLILLSENLELKRSLKISVTSMVKYNMYWNYSFTTR